MGDPVPITVQLPHTYVRQLLGKPMSQKMLTPNHVGQSARTSAKAAYTAENNRDRVREFIEMRVNEVSPGDVPVVCQLDLEIELNSMTPLPANVTLRHFNDVAGEDSYGNVALIIIIGRTLPWPTGVERIARALFGRDVVAIPGWYAPAARSVRMRDGSIAALPACVHPDPHVETVRWQICEGGLIQAVGRCRAANRPAENPVQIDILTDVPLPIVIDELTTWPVIQPSYAEIMRSRGAVPLAYRDMAAAYRDLFRSGEAARKALDRENPDNRL